LRTDLENLKKTEDQLLDDQDLDQDQDQEKDVDEEFISNQEIGNGLFPDVVQFQDQLQKIRGLDFDYSASEK
jgi:hypothetical protein